MGNTRNKRFLVCNRAKNIQKTDPVITKDVDIIMLFRRKRVKKGD